MHDFLWASFVSCCVHSVLAVYAKYFVAMRGNSPGPKLPFSYSRLVAAGMINRVLSKAVVPQLATKAGSQSQIPRD